MLVTAAQMLQALDAARKFNKSYDNQLQLAHNDCRTHTTALVKHLTECLVQFDLQGRPCIL